MVIADSEKSALTYVTQMCGAPTERSRLVLGKKKKKKKPHHRTTVADEKMRMLIVVDDHVLYLTTAAF